MLLTKEVFAAEIYIYFNNEITEYKASVIDNYIYMPLVFYRDYADVELKWLPESREVDIIIAPETYESRQNLDGFLYRLAIGETALRGIGFFTGIIEENRFFNLGMFFEKPVFILNNRTMIPFCSVEDESRKDCDGHVTSYFHESQINTRQYRDGAIYFSAYHTTGELYEIDEIDPDEWVASFDENYGLSHTHILKGSETTAIVCI